MTERLIISVKEARKLLGKEARELSDEQVIDIINLLSAAARHYLKKKRVKKSRNGLGL